MDGKTTDMTLETANRIVQEQGELACKEALAIVRGGMTICEKKADGSRKYVWVKIYPTTTDDESSIDVALEIRRRGKTKQQPNTNKGENLKEADISYEPLTPKLSKEPETQEIKPSFLERLKKKALEIWREIDSIVIE